MSDIGITRFVRRLGLHGELSQESAEEIRSLPWRTVKRARQAYVLREGDEPNEVSVLISGVAQRQKHTSEGTRQIVAFSVPGDPLDFDCLFLPEADFSVQMCDDGMISCVRTEVIASLLAGNAEINRAVHTALLADGAVAREWVLNVGRRDARRRIAHLLCEIITRLNAQNIDTKLFRLPFTQEQLADATGLTPVHVNRILGQLTSEGVISRTGRLISVPDWGQLREIADFDERFLGFVASA